MKELVVLFPWDRFRPERIIPQAYVYENRRDFLDSFSTSVIQYIEIYRIDEYVLLTMEGSIDFEKYFVKVIKVRELNDQRGEGLKKFHEDLRILRNSYARRKEAIVSFVLKPNHDMYELIEMCRDANQTKDIILGMENSINIIEGRDDK